MQIGHLHIADSLVRLIEREGTPCCKILARIIRDLNHKTLCYPDYCRSTCYGPNHPTTRWYGKGTRLLNPNLPGNYFSFREKEGMISYCPNSREQVINEDGTWARKGRQEMKPARWIKAMLHPRLAKRIKDNVFTEFDTLIKREEMATKVSFMEVDFEDAYKIENYDEDNLPGSCMWGENVGPFYRRVGAQAWVAVNRNGKYIGRAVVWPEVHVPGKDETITLMDRIYTNPPEVLESFKAFAREQGWHHKVKQGADYLKGVVAPDGSRYDYTMRIHSKKDFGDTYFFPYLDTFCGSESDRVLINSEDTDDGVEYVYRDTDGGREECSDPHEGQVQDVDGNWINEDDAVSINGDYYSCFDDRIVTCHRTGNYVLREECYEVSLSRNETVIIHRDWVSSCD